MRKNEVEIILSKPNAHVLFDKIGFTGSFYIEVDAIETLWHQLKEKVNIIYDLDIFAWGMKEFVITDNNGYIIQFGENIND